MGRFRSRPTRIGSRRLIMEAARAGSAKPHLAFSFDLRFYAIDPSSPTLVLPAGPRTTLMVFGAGISIK